jgi:hypothetical protein
MSLSLLRLAGSLSTLTWFVSSNKNPTVVSSVVNDSDLILLYNVSVIVGEYNPYLIFFDKDLNSHSACYFASQKIDSIKSGHIFGLINKTRIDRQFWYRMDLPYGYYLNLVGKIIKGFL